MRKIEASSWRDEPYVPPQPKTVGNPRRGFARGTGHDGRPHGFGHEYPSRGWPDRARGQHQYRPPRPVGHEPVPPWRRPPQHGPDSNAVPMSAPTSMPNHVRFDGGGWHGSASGTGQGPIANESRGPSNGCRSGRGGFNGEFRQSGRGRGGLFAHTAYQYRSLDDGQWQDPAGINTTPDLIPPGDISYRQPANQPTHNP